nr:hypothetical protein [Candidatus Sigynarchaeota archaeon]
MWMQEWLGCQRTVALPWGQQPGLLQNRLRDGRLRLPVDAWLATTMCQASGTMYCSRGTHPFCRLAGSLMTNQSKLTINLVTSAWQNALICLAKRQAGRRCYSIFNISPSVVPPGNSECLKETMNVDHPEHGKPVHPHDEETWYAVRKEGGRMSRQRN